MSEFSKPRRFDYPIWCRLFGHRWTECEDGWYCWGGDGHAMSDEDQMKIRPVRKPETIFIVRDSAERMEAAFREYVEAIPREAVAKIKRHNRVDLVDGTRIIGLSRAQAEQGTRGYSNVRYA